MVAALQPKRSQSRRGSSRPRTGGAASFSSRPTTTGTLTGAVPEEAATDHGNLIPWPPVSPSSLKEPTTPPSAQPQAPAAPPLTLKQQLVGARRVVMKRIEYAEDEFGAASKGDLSELRAIEKELLLIARAPKDPSEVVKNIELKSPKVSKWKAAATTHF